MAGSALRSDVSASSGWPLAQPPASAAATHVMMATALRVRSDRSERVASEIDVMFIV
jgi:hypothetical protein